jgi:hypothetical protein
MNDAAAEGFGVRRQSAAATALLDSKAVSRSACHRSPNDAVHDGVPSEM